MGDSVDYLLGEQLKSHHAPTYYHSLRVSYLCYHVGRRLNFSQECCSTLWRAGFLHDIGKLLIPVSVLSYPGKLSNEQYETIKSHVTLGCSILESYEVQEEVIAAVKGHHEREDGSGYPNGGTKHSVLSKVLAVCDVYDAMTDERSYKKAWGRNETLDSMRNGNLGAFHIPFVDALIQVVQMNKNVAFQSAFKFPARKEHNV